MSENHQADITILKRLFLHARRYWPHVGAIFVLDLLATPLALLTPLPLMLAVDSVIGSKPLPSLLAAVAPPSLAGSKGGMLMLVTGLVVAIALLSQSQKLGGWLLQTYVGEKLALEFRSQLLRHAQRLSFAYHDSRGTSDAIYRIQYDAPAIHWIVIYGITPFITAAFTLAGMVIIAAKIDWALAIVALAVSPIILILTRVFRERLRNQWRDAKKLEHSALSVIQEVLGALRVVKAFGQEEREHGRFLRRSSDSVWAHIRVVVSESTFNMFVGLTIALGTAAVLFIGVTHVQRSVLSLGELLLIMSYLAQLFQPLQTIGQHVATLQGGLASAERAFTLLDQPADVSERSVTVPLRRAAGAIIFDRVSFSYGGDSLVLRDISFDIPAGSKIGVVGRTGAGKTTLINLLIRFYDPVRGRILLDGVDIRDYRLVDYRDQFAIVQQEPVLFSTSIAENIAYARPDASDAEIAEAAKAADAHEFIMALPGGYETMVGERGMCLSGGQRQRIALARAFLKDAPVLILDEPTSSVDVKTEAAIMKAMSRLMRGRTTFMIAHRLGTLNDCDMLLQLDGGTLVTRSADITATRTLQDESAHSFAKGGICS